MGKPFDKLRPRAKSRGCKVIVRLVYPTKDLRRFEAFKKGSDTRPESRGIPEAYMAGYVEDFRGAITQ
jgi:hypothetical protein